MRIIDTFGDISLCFNDGLFSLDDWRSYMRMVYPQATEMIERDSACYDFQHDILPILNAAFADHAKLQKLHQSFQVTTRHLEESIKKHLQVELDADIVLYLGLCNGAGWATSINGKPVVLLGIEKIAELNWVDETSMIALIYHEIGHLWHYQERTLFCGGSTTEEKALWQLYSEGIAMYCEQLLCHNPSFFHQDQKGWLEWCNQNRTRLFIEYFRRVEQHESVQDFFGDWCSFEGYSDVGYYLGAELIRKALTEYTIDDVLNLSMSDVKRLLFLCLKES